jgi:hypothetical protein
MSINQAGIEPAGVDALITKSPMTGTAATRSVTNHRRADPITNHPITIHRITNPPNP